MNEDEIYPQGNKSICMLCDYAWPDVPGIKPQAMRWNGRCFIERNTDESADFANEGKPVLCYTDAESHWSEELTELHESEAGNGDHPIDVASRHIALQSIEKHAVAGNGIVLDVGCSSGFFLRDFCNKYPGAPVMGADYIAGPLHRLAKTQPGVPLLQFDLRACPLPDNSLDAVVCLNVLEHIDQDQQALAEIYRILRPGGIAHIEVPAAPSCYDIYDEYLMHHRRYTMRALVGKAETVGFRIDSRTHLGFLIFPLFYFIKKRNRRFFGLTTEQKADKVRKMMRTTRRSILMNICMRLELFWGKFLALPFGIRCVLILKKL